MKKHAQKQAWRRTAVLLGVLGATAVMAGPSGLGRRPHAEAVALDEVVLVSKTPMALASGDHNTLPISGTFFGLLGGMVGQDGGATGTSNPDVIISSAVGDDGGDIRTSIFTPDFLGSLFAPEE